MKRFIFALLIATVAATAGSDVAAQSKINASLSQVDGQAETTVWILHGDTRRNFDTGSPVPGMTAGHLEISGRASVGQTATDGGDYEEALDRLVGRVSWASIGQDMNLYVGGDILSELTSAEAYGSDYSIRLSAGIERKVAVPGLTLAGRFGYGVDYDRHQDHEADSHGLVSSVVLLVELPAGELESHTETFRGSDAFSLQSYNTLSARLTGNFIATANINVLKLRERDTHTELLVGVGLAF